MKTIRVLIMTFMLVGGLALLVLPPLAPAETKALVSVIVPQFCVHEIVITKNTIVTPGTADFRDDVSTAITEARFVRQTGDSFCTGARVSIRTCDDSLPEGNPHTCVGICDPA